MKYREIEYTYKQWAAHNGKVGACYTCNDKKLFKHTNLVTLEVSTAYEMRKEIDYYLDNVSLCESIQELELKAGVAFYEHSNSPKD